MRRRCVQWVSSLVVLSLLLSIVPTAQAAPAVQGGATVSPPSIAVDLAPGQSVKTTVTVQTAATPIPKVDVLFLFDVTNSMKDVLNQAKARGSSIMNSLRAKVPDAAFGAASFCDYPGKFSSPGYEAEYGAPDDYPWRLDQEITSDIAATQRAIDGLALKKGQDGAEDYATALFEALLIGWRPGAKHIIVLFGDAPAHDPDFYVSRGGGNTGVDPGPDGTANTPDDLTLASVIAQVRDRGVVILPVNSDAKQVKYVQAGFEYMAQQTGGQVYPLAKADDLSSTVAAGRTTSTSKITALSLQADPAYAAWVAVQPPTHANVGGGETRTFEVTITAPANAPSSNYTFLLTAAGDRASLGGVKVTVAVRAPGMSVDPQKVLDDKRKLIKQMSELPLRTEFFGILVDTHPTTTYAAQEREVESWLALLPAPGAMSPGQVDALHRLDVHEDGVYRLWNAGADSAHVGNAEMAHIAGLVFSLISAFSKVFTFLEKSLVGKLVTKLNAYVISKMIAIWLTALDWSLVGLKEDVTRQGLQAEMKGEGEAFQAAIKNGLKTTNFAKSFGWDLFAGLLESALVTPLDKFTSGWFAQSTAREVTSGLTLAKAASQATVDGSVAEQEALRVMREADRLVAPVEDQADALQREGKELEDTHIKLGLASDFTAAFSTVLALSPTGFGNAAGVLGHLISIALKVVDGIMSGVLAADAYASWDAGRQVALGLDDRVFSRPVAQPLDSLPPELAGPVMPAALNGKRPAGLAIAARPGTAAEVALAPEAELLLARVHTRVTSYTELVTQLAAAAKSDNPTGAQQIADKLLDADTDLSAEFRASRQPVFVAAPDLIAQRDAGFRKAYATLGRSAAAFDGEGAILYTYLLGWLAEPKSAEAQRLLTEQANVVVDRTLAHEAALQQALAFAGEAVRTPSAVITRGAVPTELLVGAKAGLAIEVTNSGSQEATNVVITLDPGQNAQATSSREQRVGTLKAGESRTVTFDFTPATSFGLLSVTSQADNGRGSFIVVPFSAITSTTPASTPGSGSALGLIVGLAGLVGAVIVVTAAARRRRAAVGPAQSARAQLIGLAGQGAYSVGDRAVLGRDLGCALRLADPYVSRRHAQLRYAEGAWYIQDLGSKGGTFVNGNTVVATTLRNGDRVRVGGTEFEFRTGG